MYRSTRAACEARLGDSSVFRLLAQHGHRLFPDSSTACMIGSSRSSSTKLPSSSPPSTLQRSRNRQRDPNWKRRYRATRPKVERKFGHMMRRRHGGRRARVRGRQRVGHDFALLAAAINLARLARLGLCHDGRIWAC